MKITRTSTSIRDERGEITDILVNENIEHVTMITSAQGTTRGNHYHKETVQYVYILKGRMKLLTQFPEEPVVSAVLEVGDVALTEPNERHAMEALEDSAFLVFTRGVRGGNDYERDTFRLSAPLKEEVITGAQR